MSEASDDAQLAAKGEAPPAGALDAAADHDDVEVVAHAEPDPPPRHDSVSPGSRKLAPPPKPKRDSSHPASIPPPPEQPTISYQDASGAVKPGTGLAEELNQEAGAFAAREAPSGTKPMAPRPRSKAPSISGMPAATEVKPTGSDPPVSLAPETRPSEGVMLPGPPPPPSRDKLPTLPDDPSRMPSSPPKSGGIFAQRIIAVGTPSRPPPAAPFEPTLSQPAAPPPPPPPPPAVMEVPPPPIAVAVPPPSPVVAAPPPSASPSAPDLTRTLDSAPEIARPASTVVRSAGPPPPPPPPPVELSPNGPATPPRAAFVDDAPPRIPSGGDFEDEEPTAPNASVEPLPAPAPALAAPLIPAEPTPPPPGAAAPREAAASTPDEVAPDSADRIAVEELSREDSPSLPPDEPAAVAPPPAPSARAEAKQPPPPPKRAPAPTTAASTEVAASPETDKKKEKAKQKRAWWEELFSEDFVRANWKVSEAQIKKEVTFVEESLGVAPGGVVLDLGCGAGQHAVELASRGYGVVGYDLSLYQLALAADIAQERSQKLNFLQGDMREMAFEEMFDGIFSWNTSFGYFEEDKNYSVAERTFRALRPGGMFLIDVMNRDFVAAHTPSSVWFEGDACVCMDDATIDYFTSRLRVKRSVILDDGRTRECTYSVRLYSFHELGKLLHDVGFRVTEVSGHPSTPGVFLGQASPRILMLAQRP